MKLRRCLRYTVTICMRWTIPLLIINIYEQSQAEADRPLRPCMVITGLCCCFHLPGQAAFVCHADSYLLTGNGLSPFSLLIVGDTRVSGWCKITRDPTLSWEPWERQSCWGFHELMVKYAISTVGGKRTALSGIALALVCILHHPLNRCSQQPCNTYSFSQEIPLFCFIARASAPQILWLPCVFKCPNLFK